MDFDLSPSDRQTELRATLTKERRFRFLVRFEEMLRSFSPAERLALYALAALLALSTLILMVGIDIAASVEVPASGGSLVEGELAPARFINPVLTLSQADEDLTQLVYSGLTRATPDGSYIPDLAQNYDISPDGTTYTFHLRPNATFQDGTKVTAQDVLFTVQAAQNPAIKSPRRADWDGVQASAPDDKTVVFKLPHAYAPFIDNTTMGILPKHVWQSVPAEEFPFAPANTRPIGSGPYRVADVSTDSTGSPTRYDLVPFSHFTLGEPHLSHITFLFYANEDAMLQAFNARRIDAIAGVSPEGLASLKRTDTDLARVALPRTFGIFFNQSHAPVLADASVRAALSAAVDEQQLVKSVLGGYGVALQGPVPPEVLGNVIPASPMAFMKVAVASTTPNTANYDAARAILQKGGWKWDDKSSTWSKGSGKSKQTLSFTLATADQPELVATAQQVAAEWRAIGASVNVQVYALSDLNTSIIRPRAYDAILFGEVVGRTLDLFAFWHSSQRNDPGLNLALYANSKVDALLSQARATTDASARDKLYAQFSAAVEKDQPAVFLYAPQFLYLVPKDLQGVEIGALTTPSERFLNVYQWYTGTEYVWSIFTNQTN
jgi:peptide/nickel transport system substrate-binding protein